MSHHIEYFDYDISKNPKDIEANLANYVQHETWQEGRKAEVCLQYVG